MAEVRVTNFDPKAKQVFAIAGGELLLSKVILDQIAGAAGISWMETRRIDDGKHPHYYQMFVKGQVTGFDGATRTITGTKAIDLREDAGNGIMGKDYEEIVSKAKKKNRSYENQLREARKFIGEIAESKAKNRAISGGLGIKRAYTRAELNKPFIVPKLAIDSQHPAAQTAILANLTGATGALFGEQQRQLGAGAAVVEATLEPSDGEPSSSGGEEAAAPNPAAASNTAGQEPPHDPDTGEVLDDPIAIVKREWARAKEAGMDPKGFGALCKSATEKERKEDMTLDDAQAVTRAVNAFIANSEPEPEPKPEPDDCPV